MIDTDANTHAMNQYLDKQQKQEEAWEEFENIFAIELRILEEDINKLQKYASDYNGYDFTEDIEELIKDML